jgi:protein-S-isoprenylcysteine O-methyltransferase Ste14
MVVRLIVQTVAWVAFMAALLFLAAGTVRWPAAWGFLAEVGLPGLALGLWLARHDPQLLAERLSSPIQRQQPTWDRFGIAAFLLGWSGWLVLMALDAARYGFSHVPSWLQAAGALGVLLSIYVGYLTFQENSFAAPVVKIQKERGQRVVTTGPYRYVRHPLYTGALFFLLGTPLLLGSWLGLAVAPVLIAGLAARIVMEERVLSAELDGYVEYAQNVPYRLIPPIW